MNKKLFLIPVMFILMIGMALGAPVTQSALCTETTDNEIASPILLLQSTAVTFYTGTTDTSFSGGTVGINNITATTATGGVVGTCVSLAVNANIEIKVYKGEHMLTSNEKVDKGDPYKVQVTITPDADMVGHLMLAKVSYNNVDKTIFSNFQPSLAGNTDEVLEFTTTVPEDATGDMLVKSFCLG